MWPIKLNIQSLRKIMMLILHVSLTHKIESYYSSEKIIISHQIYLSTNIYSGLHPYSSRVSRGHDRYHKSLIKSFSRSYESVV